MSKHEFEKLWSTVLPESKSAGERPWGTEELLAIGPDNIIMKRLTIKAGTKGGLQYHRKRVEAGYVVTGKLIVRLGLNGIIEEKILESGDHYIFPQGVIHQEEAVEDTIIIECSNPWLNDRVRVEDQFGIEDLSGLPTTQPGDEIKV